MGLAIEPGAGIHGTATLMEGGPTVGIFNPCEKCRRHHRED